MNRLLAISRFWLFLFAIVIAGAAFSACSDDPAAPPPPAGSSKISVMHANTEITGDVLFKRDTTTLSGNQLAYGATASATIPNGNSTISVRALSGSQLASAGVSLDSNSSTWVIFSGTIAQPEAFAVKSTKVNATGPNAAVRIIHASNNAGDVSIKLNDLNGLSFTQNKLAYKNGTSYVTLPVATTSSLVVVKGEGTTATPLLTIGTTGAFAAGKSYTLVIYGSADPNAAASVKLASKIVED